MRGAWIVAAALGVACSGKGDTADTGEVDVLTLVTSRGPYGVGYVESEVRYPDPAGDGERVNRLAIWYPTDASSGTPVERYFSLFPAEEDVWEAPAPAALGPRPVWVHSHGSQAYAEASAFFMTHLASHGWLVASCDHTSNTTFDGDGRTTPIYLQRPLDVSAVIDHLQDLPASDPLAGLASDTIVASGHSFGGYTVHALAGATYDVDGACTADPDSAFCGEMTPDFQAAFEAGLDDPRIAAFVSMAAGDVDKYGDGLKDIDRPIFDMTADLDGPEGNEELWDLLADSADPMRIDVAGGGHNMFTDFSGTVDANDQVLDAEEGFRIVRAYGLAWGMRHTGDDRAEGVLSGEIEVSELVTLTP